MKIKIFIISIIVAITSVNAFAQYKFNSKFSNLHKEYVLNEDGSIDYTYRQELELLSIRSFDSDYGETFIIYNPKYQSIKINEVYTLKADGSKVACPANAITESLPYSCTNCQRYNGMKEMVVSHTGTEVGGKIVLDYTIHTNPTGFNNLMDVVDFVEFSPVEEYIVTVKTPVNIDLRNRMLNLRLGPEITSDGEYNVYTWNLTNVEQSSSESYLPNGQVYPKLIFTSFKDMQKAYFAFTNQDAFRNYSLPQCHNMLRTLAKEDNAFNNIMAIRNYVIDAIHLNNIELSKVNYAASTAATTWNSSCGTPLDKAVLLTAMLKEAGYNAVPVAIIDERYYSDEVACLDLISTFAVKVNIDGEDFYLSSTERNNCSLEYVYNGYMMFPIDAAIDHLVVKKFAPISNAANIKGNIVVKNDNEISGNIECNITSAGIDFNQMKNNNQKLADYVTVVKGDVKNATVEKINMNFSMDINGMNISRMGETNYYSFNIPSATNTFSINPSYLAEKRDNSVKCKTTKENYSYTITLPEGARVVSKNINKTMETSFGKMHIEIIANGNVLTINRSLEITSEIIQPHQYKDLRAMIIEWNNINGKEIVVIM